MAAVGEKVLLVDADPQANASTGLGILRPMRAHTLYDVLMEAAPAASAAIPTAIPGLHLLAGDADLSGMEIEAWRQPRAARSGSKTRFRPSGRPATTTMCSLIVRRRSAS